MGYRNISVSVSFFFYILTNWRLLSDMGYRDFPVSSFFFWFDILTNWNWLSNMGYEDIPVSVSFFLYILINWKLQSDMGYREISVSIFFFGLIFWQTWIGLAIWAMNIIQFLFFFIFDKLEIAKQYGPIEKFKFLFSFLVWYSDKLELA